MLRLSCAANAVVAVSGWLQNAKNGQYFGQPRMVNAGKATATLVSDVLAGTQFRVCAASPNGFPGGPYDADLSY